MRAVSVGYVMPPLDLAEGGEWHILTRDGELVELQGNEIKSWRYLMSLQVDHTVSVKLHGLRDACGLSDADELRLVPSWRASSTGLQGCGAPVTVVDGVNHLEMAIAGTEAGGELELKAELTLGTPAKGDRSPLLPVRPGSILWTEYFRLHLEGDANRFPTEAVSFGATGVGHPGAAWLVEVETSDLDAPALDRVRLVLNTDHALYRLLSEVEDPAVRAARSFLQYDVARELVAAALSCEELVDEDEYAHASVGEVLRSRLKNYFGFEPGGTHELRARWHDNPRAIESALQASFFKP